MIELLPDWRPPRLPGYLRRKEKLAKLDQGTPADYWDFSSLAGLTGLAFLCVRGAFGFP